LTGLDKSVLQIKSKIVSCHTVNSKPVKQEANGTVILPPLVFPVMSNTWLDIFSNKLFSKCQFFNLIKVVLAKLQIFIRTDNNLMNFVFSAKTLE
jgi:hypothetical protein